MKVLSYLSVLLGVAALAGGIYLIFVVVPQAEAAESLLFDPVFTDYNLLDAETSARSMAAMDLKVDLGIIVMFAGLAALLLGIFPAIKKQKLAWLGILTGLAAGIIGAAYGTHMFS